MTDIKKQPDTYRVNLFLSFTSAALFAIGFPMTLYEATMAAQDPPQLVLFGTSLELSVLLVEVPTGVIADFFSQRISIIMGHFLIGMGLIIETGTLIDNTSLMSIKGTPAGGGASTVEDILNFNEALLSYRLLTPEATELLLAGKVEIREGIRYAYGLMDKMIGGQRVVGHGGNAPGICNLMDMYLDPGYTIIILSNTDGGCLFVREFIRENPLNTAHEKKKWARLGLNQRPSDYESES